MLKGLFTALLVLLVCSGSRAAIEKTLGEGSTTITVPMRAHFENTNAQPLPVEPVNGPFSKEPVFTSNGVIRGKIKITEPDIDLPFLWTGSTGYLYADLNRNLDLTDDGPPGQLSFTTKTLDLAVLTSTPLSVVQIPIQVSVIAGRKDPGFHRLRAYRGSFELEGKEWNALVYRRPGAREQYDFSFVPHPANLPPSLRWTTRISILEGHQFLTEFQFSPEAGNPVLQLLPLESSGYGELVLPGKSIDQIYMMGNIPPEDSQLLPQNVDSMKTVGNSSRAFISYRPNPTIRVPAGHYDVYQIALHGGLFGTLSPTGPKVTVNKDRQTTLLVGGPVKNTVVVETLGSYLKLSYRKRGIGGEEYYSGPADRACFAVFKGERKILAGDFEYG